MLPWNACRFITQGLEWLGRGGGWPSFFSQGLASILQCSIQEQLIEFPLSKHILCSHLPFPLLQFFLSCPTFSRLPLLFASAVTEFYRLDPGCSAAFSLALLPLVPPPTTLGRSVTLGCFRQRLPPQHLPVGYLRVPENSLTLRRLNSRGWKGNISINMWKKLINRRTEHPSLPGLQTMNRAGSRNTFAWA